MATALGTFRALDHVFDLAVAGDLGVDVGVLFGHLALGADDPAEPEVTYTLTAAAGGDDMAGTLHADDDLVASGRDRVLLQMLITRLGRDALGPGAVAFHATTLADDHASVVLVGPSRRGKSTLAARLLLDGLRLVAEDITALAGEPPSVRPYLRPIGLSEDSFAALGVPIPAAAGEPCGCGGKVLVAPEHLGIGTSEPKPIRAVVLVDHQRDDLVSLTPAAMLSRLLECGSAFTDERPEGLGPVAEVLAGARCVELGSADLAVAADWVGQLVAEPPPEPQAALVEVHEHRTDVFIGTEAVVVEDGIAHHLNRTAAAVWLLHTDGLARDEIAAELGADRTVVDDTLTALA